MTRRLVAVVAVLAVTGAACGDEAPSDPATGAAAEASVEATPRTDVTSSPAARRAGCRAPEHPALQTGSHLIGEAEPPVPYSSVPPTSGWHASGRPEPGVHDTPLTEPQMVSVLEGGAVLAAYDPDQLAAEEVTALEALASGPLADRLSVVPYEVDMPTPLALTAWGVLQRCDTLDEAAVTSFVEANYGQTGDDDR